MFVRDAVVLPRPFFYARWISGREGSKALRREEINEIINILKFSHIMLPCFLGGTLAVRGLKSFGKVLPAMEGIGVSRGGGGGGWWVGWRGGWGGWGER
jgi:hypothetical protein